MITTLLGITVGLVLALTGAGGGILAVPLLVFGLHLSIAEAGPISLLAVGMAAAFGAILGLKAGIVRYRAATLIALAGITLTPLGNWCAHQVQNSWLTILFSVVMVFVAYRTSVQVLYTREPYTETYFNQPCLQDNDSGKFIWTARCARLLALAGATAGFLSGLLGVGGGFVIVPALSRFSNLDMKATISTSLGVIAIVSLVSVVNSSITGHINWAIASPFGMGALIGMLIGGLIAKRLAGTTLQTAFAFLSLVTAIVMFLKALNEIV
jgi:uncharacterized protein